ncbi:hypothetical protein [Candidatus Puniceispirillum marinum]|uniref:Uncharacterized protein n=1 Tax=Puniceispirillum marinum (strain IMCC1322) TaxID=488538 RepID=D5BTF0_PUNMI|nr:hypothetical protein [Candidatus Puniceispirillum marinum]ADE39547.1 hypothetical protein SAR116_1304 [Candidatus Puniceispirillum marinum IMCC1322]
MEYKIKSLKRIISIIFVFGFGAGASFLFFTYKNSDHDYKSMHERHHSQSGMAEGNTHKHDEVNMPGLQGKDTTDQEVNDLKTIFQEHKGIKRDVINLANGIKTTTEAHDVKLRDAITSHVSMMVTRLQQGKNPEVMIQSPTLDALFEVYEEIETEIETTELGVAVIQTSSNPEVVKFLQTHAAEVSDMSARGMVAVHERMMRTTDE